MKHQILVKSRKLEKYQVVLQVIVLLKLIYPLELRFFKSQVILIQLLGQSALIIY